VSLPDFGNLLSAATAARAHAIAPYSGFRVGAALESRDGRIFSGCNVENASFGLTMCAERVALLKALSEGAREFRAIVVVADAATPTPPCGACRQLLWEHAGNLIVVLASTSGTTGEYQLAELLPHPFDARLLKGTE
jgi:cytidine deaminase